MNAHSLWSNRLAVIVIICATSIPAFLPGSECLAQIVQVTKRVACAPPGGDCSTLDESVYRRNLRGFRTPTQSPTFCYRIVVTNLAQSELTNIQVSDDQLDLSGCSFPSTLPVGGSATCFVNSQLDDSNTNVVTVSAQTTAKTSTVSSSAVVILQEATLACAKLVSSPDDLDGQAGGDHVSLPADGQDHNVTYKVRITSGPAPLRRVTIADPLLEANGCVLPEPFGLTANTTTTLVLCTLPFNCPAVLGECGNPLLGAAGQCAVLELDGGKVDMTGPPGGVIGDVCVGPNGQLSMSGSQFISGNVRLSPGATFSHSGSTTVGGVLNNQDLSAEINAALAAASNAAAQSCTQTFSTLSDNQTITGGAGMNVICITDVKLDGGKVVKLSGPASAQFILNVTGKFALTGGSKILVTGGLKAQNVLYNVEGTGDVSFSGGGGGQNCCNTSIDGTLLAPDRKIALSPGLVNGAVISGKDISIVSGASVRCPAPPGPAVNTITVRARVGTFSGSACAEDSEGRPFSLTSRCSATVECQP